MKNKRALNIIRIMIIITVSWVLVNTITGQDPSIHMEAIKAGSGGINEYLGIALYAGFIALGFLASKWLKKVWPKK